MLQEPARDATLGDILEELRSQRRRKKDFWDLLGPASTFISAVILGTIGLMLTHGHNTRQDALTARQLVADSLSRKDQVRVLEMTAVEKLFPYITTNDEKRKYALFVISTLGSPQFAIGFAKLDSSSGTQAAADRIMASGASVDQTVVPPAVTASVSPGQDTLKPRTGWVYLGHYVSADQRWETRYFNFGPGVDPGKLPSTVQTVRKQTGAINVRTDMPSLEGEFRNVLDVLKPESSVRVKSVREWYSTGYMWAEVEYGI